MDINRAYENILPPSPPRDDDLPVIAIASKLLRAKAGALSSIADIYECDKETQLQFGRALSIMQFVLLSGGKIVITGMGKSFKIASKLVSTLQSFSIAAATLHPSEALHGDLGNTSGRDVIVMISASGSTPELLLLLKHLPKQMEKICITCKAQSPLGLLSSAVIAANVPEEYSEEQIYGLTAPTVTTTACLAVGDAMCVALYEAIEQDSCKRVKIFSKCHPGGAIGQQYANQYSEVPWDDLPKLPSLADADEIVLWRSCYSYPYVLCGETLYLSEELMNALRRGSRSAKGYALSEVPRLARKDLGQFKGFAIMRGTPGEKVLYL